MFEPLGDVVGLLQTRGVLHAGGNQDASDIRSILAAADGAQVRAEVEARLPGLRRDCSALWRRILDGP